jgi:hypothetical protein
MPRNLRPASQPASSLYAQPIDRISPTREPISLQMAKAMIRLRQQLGAATDAGLLAMGFTRLDLAAHGDEARMRAAKLRPDLASPADRRHARSFGARVE